MGQTLLSESIGVLPDFVLLRDLRLTECPFQDLVDLAETALAARLEQLTLRCSVDGVLPVVYTPFTSLRRLTLDDHMLTQMILEPALIQIASLEIAAVRLMYMLAVPVLPPEAIQIGMRARRVVASTNAAMVPCRIELTIVWLDPHVEVPEHVIRSYDTVLAESDALVRFELFTSDQQ